jgi:hypothetical protein
MSPLTKKSLFWDADANKIDLTKNKRYVIERILKFGNLADYSWLKNLYKEDEIKEVIRRERSELDKKSLNFWCNIYNIDYYALRNIRQKNKSCF